MREQNTSFQVPVAQRMLIYLGLLVLFLWALWLLKSVISVLLILFMGILFGVFVRGIADFIDRKTLLSAGWSLGITFLFLLALATLFGWLLGPHLASQLEDLNTRIPTSLDEMRAMLRQYGLGESAMSFIPSGEELQRDGDLMQRTMRFFSTALGALANVVIILIVGIYLAVNPQLYRKGLLHLVPQMHRERAEVVLDALGDAMRSWLLGRILSMIIVGIFTGIGLWALGVPLVLTLATLAALLSFVPYLGPIASAIPAMLVGFTVSPQMALFVGLLYLGVQLVESNLITPLIQQRVVSLPPVVLIASQAIMGVLTGIVGVLVATPLAVVVIVLVQMLYIQDVLDDDDVEILGST